jgi:hydroxymethylpyrimidine pyrophosphatase-like HAD family hydrolase
LAITEQYGIALKNVIAVGDSRNDLCMIIKSGLGVSFCSNDEILNEYADFSLKTPSFSPLLSIET